MHFPATTAINQLRLRIESKKVICQHLHRAIGGAMLHVRDFSQSESFLSLSHCLQVAFTITYSKRPSFHTDTFERLGWASFHLSEGTFKTRRKSLRSTMSGLSRVRGGISIGLRGRKREYRVQATHRLKQCVLRVLPREAAQLRVDTIYQPHLTPRYPLNRFQSIIVVPPRHFYMHISLHFRPSC